MASSTSLTNNDNITLHQIFDPESTTAITVLIDPSLASDPVIHEPNTLERIRLKQKAIVDRVESVAREPKGSRRREETLWAALEDLSVLLREHPCSACLLNDHAQLIRLTYGDDALMRAAGSSSSQDLKDLAKTALEELGTAIELLTPPASKSAVSPAQARTLAQAHTQRGAMYHAASKVLASEGSAKGLSTNIQSLRGLSALDLEEAASKEFFMGGRYGSRVGKALAVHINPTAKLCGQMVQSAMQREMALQDPGAV